MGDSVQTKLDKLDAVLRHKASRRRRIGRCSPSCLSLPNDGRYARTNDLAPQQRRQRTLEALITQIMALAEQNPLS